MTRGRGGSQTPSRVVELLQKAIAEKGQSTLEKETGLSHSMISRYKRGIGEPSQATIEKLAEYFGVNAGWLRGDPLYHSKPVKDSGFIDISGKKTVITHNGENILIPQDFVLDLLNDLYTLSINYDGAEPSIIEVKDFIQRTKNEFESIKSGGTKIQVRFSSRLQVE